MSGATHHNALFLYSCACACACFISVFLFFSLCVDMVIIYHNITFFLITIIKLSINNVGICVSS